MLPGSDCKKCGFATCEYFAQYLVAGMESCPEISSELRDKLTITEVGAKPAVKKPAARKPAK
jgi:Na+-translocating ferredoxin:NAD+ oxidoreductase RNF subunit RnfB